MSQADRAAREGRLEDAQAILINIVVREPRNDEAWLLLANVLTDPERKLECLRRALEIAPHNSAIRRAIEELQASLAPGRSEAQPTSTPPQTSSKMEQTAPIPQSPTASSNDSDHAEVIKPLLEYGESIAQAVLLTTESSDTRQVGQELVRVLGQALRHEPVLTRRWARSAGRAALVKYEKALSSYISNLPQNDPHLNDLREQRHSALDLLK